MAAAPSFTGSELVPRRISADVVEDLQRVQKTAQKISSILDLDQLIESVVHEVTQSFGCVEAGIYLHDEERSELELAGVHGCTLHHKGHRLKIGVQGMVGHVASTGQMHYAPDVRRDPYYIRCEQALLSEVAIPLLVGDGWSEFSPRLIRSLMPFRGHS